jgi:Spy/CpxP family protein refolding chaperone
MQRLAPVFLFALTFVLGGLGESAPAHAEDAELIDAPADAPKTGGAKAPIPGGPNDPNALWWEDPTLVEALSLTDEQRKKMGEILSAYRKKLPQIVQPEAFHETLVQGDWKAARRESDKLAKNAETSVQMRGTLKIDVLSLLSKEQRETLVDRYPRVVYQPWRRAMRGAPSR